MKSLGLFHKKYVDGLTKDAIAEGEERGENRERKASILKLEKLLRQKGYSPAETKSFLKEYNAIQ